MESIIKWFETGCNYDAGVQLYEQLSAHKPVLLKNLKARFNAANLEKLKYELRKHAGTATPENKTADTVPRLQIQATNRQAPAQLTPGTNVVVPEEDVKRSPLFHQLPPELRETLLEAYELFRKNCLLKTYLNDLQPDQEDEALELQLQIFKNFERNRLCWDKIDYWQEHGHVMKPAPNKLARLSAAGKAKRQQYLFSSKGKLEKRLNLNLELLQGELTIKERTRLEKAIAKQRGNLLRQTEQLAQLTNMIDGYE